MFESTPKHDGGIKPIDLEICRIWNFWIFCTNIKLIRNMPEKLIWLLLN